MPYLQDELARAQAAVAAAQQDVDAAQRALIDAQTGDAAAAADLLKQQQAQLAQIAAPRDAIAAQTAAVATLLGQAQGDVQAAEASSAQARQALDALGHEPERPQGGDGSPLRSLLIAAWRRRQQQWRAAAGPLRQAVATADAAAAAAGGRVADITAQHTALRGQLEVAQAQLDAAQGAVNATLAQIAALQAQLSDREQALDAALAALSLAQPEVTTLMGFVAAVEREPFDRPELERAADDLGIRLRALQAERAPAAAEHAELATQAAALRAQQAATSAQLTEASAALLALQAEAVTRDTQANAAVNALFEALEQGGDTDAASAAVDAAIAAQHAAANARDSAQTTAATLDRQGAALGEAASMAEEGAAAAQAIVDELDPRIAELRTARETATARLLGDVGCDRRLVLAPVRLETRFEQAADGAALLIRIFVDDWFVDTHEPDLTADEREWGTHYHEQVAISGDDAARRLAWDQLAHRYGPQRAAWVARALDPAAPLPVGDRLGSWTRAPHTALLPDRWVAIAHGHDGEHAFTAWGEPITVDPLQVGPAPADDPLGDVGARWLTEFDAAVDAGMALRVPLVAPPEAGLARLVVAGVRAGLSDEQSAGRLGAALEAHHYTGGLAVVAPGTPSNTTVSGTTGYIRADPDGTRGFRTERGAPLISAGDGSDGALIAATLGIDASRFAHVAGADGRSHARAAAMQSALWEVADGALHQALVGAAGETAVRDLLANGSLPALRAGFQPYGLVAATSLKRWTADAVGEAALADALRTLLKTWRGAAGRVPRATPGEALDRLLAEYAHSVRFVVPGENGGPPLIVAAGVQPGGAEDGPLAPDYVTLLREADLQTVQSESFPAWPNASTAPLPHPLLYLLLRAAVLAAGDQAAVERVRAALGLLAGADAGQLRVAFLEALDTASHRLDAWISSLAASRLHTLPPAAVRFGGYGWLENLAPRAESVPVPVAPDEPVPVAPDEPPLVERSGNLGHLLTPSLAHAATAAVLRSGYAVGRDDPGAPLAVDLSSRRVAVADWILRGVRQGQPLAALLGYRFERVLQDPRYLLPLRTLAGLHGDDELEKTRAQVNVLDLQTKGLAAEHAALVRASDTARGALTAATAALQRVQELRDGLDAEKAALDGFAAAAQAADVALADINARLSAHRAMRPPLLEGRASEEVFEAWIMQEGQLEFELRAATERADAFHAPAADPGPRLAEVEQLIAGLDAVDIPTARNAEATAKTAADAALAAAGDKEAELAAAETRLGEARAAFAAELNRQWAVATESVAAANVVDGLELHRRYRAGRAADRWDLTTIPFDDTPLGFGGDARAVLTPSLDDLADAVDAVADLTLAEGVHQLVQGNPVRSGATVDAVARGEQLPPELEVIRTPRRGIGVTHRVMVLLDATSSVAPAWGAAAVSPRAAAEPRLNAWVSRLLPDPAQVRCRAELLAADDGRILDSREVAVAALGLAPLDVAYLAGRSGPLRLSELEQRLAHHAVATRPAGVPADAQPRVAIDRDPSWPAGVRSVADLLEAIGAVQALLVQARGLDARDLGAPDDGVVADDLVKRATTAAAALLGVRDALTVKDLDAVRAALVAAVGFGIEGALPASPAGDSDADREILLAQAASVGRELTERLERAQATSARPRDRLAAAFGDAFAVLPLFAAPDVSQQFARDDNDHLAGGQHLDLVGWLQRVAHVRAGAQRLSDALAAAELLDAGERLRLRVAQLPLRSPDRWVGLPPTPDFALEAGRLSLIAHVPLGSAPGTPACGLLVDEWVEVVPATTEIAGVTFHFDQPGARPPQAILVAVAPDLREERTPAAWDLDTLEAVVQETWELAQVRIVDPASLRTEDAALTGVVLPDTIELARAAAPAPGS